VFYTAEGDPITPDNFLSTGGEVRSKPDFAAADGVSTATPEFETFFGTSAAAPHAAAIAALLLELEPGFTPADVRAAFVAGSIDIEAPGFDFDSGFGIINALAALGGDDTDFGELFIVAPFGGEKWKIGNKEKIRWTSVGDPGPNVKLELLRQGSSVLTIAASTPNDELFKWEISNSVVAGNGYKVRVTSTSDPTIKDTSPFAFRIKHAK
jgi:hypothetical protein